MNYNITKILFNYTVNKYLVSNFYNKNSKNNFELKKLEKKFNLREQYIKCATFDIKKEKITKNSFFINILRLTKNEKSEKELLNNYYKCKQIISKYLQNYKKIEDNTSRLSTQNYKEQSTPQSFLNLSLNSSQDCTDKNCPYRNILFQLIFPNNE